MKPNFFTSLLSEGGPSSKRLISLCYAGASIFMGIYIVLKYKEYATTVLGYFMFATGILTGVTTIPEIAKILTAVRGGKDAPDAPQPPAPSP